jgi:hypothetical protein
MIQNFSNNKEEVGCRWAPLPHTLLNGDYCGGLSIHQNLSDCLLEEELHHGDKINGKIELMKSRKYESQINLIVRL